MNRQEFRNYLKENILILDGATGTELQKRGMPQGVCPEQWVLDNPQILIDIQRQYIQAGSTAVYTCTFGGNRIKLDEYGLGGQVVEINRRLAQISKKAVGNGGLVAGDLAPTGQFIRPVGELSFEQVVEVYKEQVKGLLEGGVDFFVIETMMDIQEARAALLAVKESCDLPVCVSMTINEDGRTLTGTDPTTAVITLQSLGADVVGCNCSTGPEKMLEFIAAMSAVAKVPLLAKANAGLPKLVDGKTVFDMEPEAFGTYAKSFVDLGVAAIGGCCGTSPEYIEQIVNNLEGVKPIVLQSPGISAVTSARKTATIGLNRPVAIVGERINPTGKKGLQAELREGKTDLVLDFALEQQEQGAVILDVNVGMPGIDEKNTMLRVVEMLSGSVSLPLCLDSSSVDVLEAALRIYPGRALINSISAEEEKLKALLPIAAKYGAMFILLPLSDEGVPKTAQERIELIKNVYERGRQYGYDKEDMVVDGLVMTVSSDQKAAMETLKVIDWSAHEFGCNTIMGLSNVSFGLPERSWVNTAFLAMAIGKGLTMAIANPSSEMLMNIKMACDVLTAKDEHSHSYIQHFAKMEQLNEAAFGKKKGKTPSEQVYDAVVKGDKAGIDRLIEAALQQGTAPKVLVDEYLIPAITQVGDLYEQKKYFLPQLIQSAEVMKKAFLQIEPLLQSDRGIGVQRKAKVVLATVKGDIHDIGKNIVALMLKNYGFEVYDLGKDISTEEIIRQAKELKADIVGLSALMTTTMLEMKKVVALAKEEKLSSKIMIGGAVVDEQYAQEIGADGYAQDAHSAVKVAKKMLGQA